MQSSKRLCACMGLLPSELSGVILSLAMIMMHCSLCMSLQVMIETAMKMKTSSPRRKGGRGVRQKEGDGVGSCSQHDEQLDVGSKIACMQLGTCILCMLSSEVAGHKCA